MYFAMSVPNIDLADIQTLFEDDPKSMVRGCNGSGLRPSQLAVMMKNPNMALFDRLKVYDPGFESRKNNVVGLYNRATPLHLAAHYSNSVVLIKELIQRYPAALDMEDYDESSPLIRSLSNNSPEAIDILQVLLDAAPQAARKVGYMGQRP